MEKTTLTEAFSETLVAASETKLKLDGIDAAPEENCWCITTNTAHVEYENRQQIKHMLSAQDMLFILRIKLLVQLN